MKPLFFNIYPTGHKTSVKMKSILYNLAPVTDKIYKTHLDEFLAYTSQLPTLLKEEGLVGTVRIDSGPYIFLSNDTIQPLDVPLNHIIACVDDCTKLDTLIQEINALYAPCPIWERFEIDDDAINAENIQLLDDLSFRKTTIKFDRINGKGTFPFSGHEETKVPSNPYSMYQKGIPQ